MLFGWSRVGPGLHFLSTAMVALGTLISATWILASNSWMQTPRGYEIVDGRVVPTDWLAVIFNPSFPYRLAHMSVAAFLATALFVAASAAWHLLRGRDNKAIRKMFSMSLWMVLFVAPLQALIGDAHGLNTLEHQPAKLAAMEGHWENRDGQGTPLVLFALPDMGAEQNHYAVEIPRLGSLILTHTWDGAIPALKDFAPKDRPNAAIVFWTFRLMVGLGMLMIALGVWSVWLRWRRALALPCIPALCPVDGPNRHHCNAGGLDDHGNWSPAVDCLWTPANQRCGVWPQHGPTEHLADDFYRRVHRRLWYRHWLSAAPGPPRTTQSRGTASARRRTGPGASFDAAPVGRNGAG